MLRSFGRTIRAGRGALKGSGSPGYSFLWPLRARIPLSRSGLSLIRYLERMTSADLVSHGPPIEEAADFIFSLRQRRKAQGSGGSPGEEILSVLLIVAGRGRDGDPIAFAAGKAAEA